MFFYLVRLNTSDACPWVTFIARVFISVPTIALTAAVIKQTPSMPRFNEPRPDLTCPVYEFQ